ncbi:MAG: hypothetical protein ACI9VM_000806 [Candidatus Azotimanducaceae bacterium]|jgi:hypothetical protein
MNRRAPGFGNLIWQIIKIGEKFQLRPKQLEQSTVADKS